MYKEKEVQREWAKKYRVKHKEKLRESKKEWYEKNKEKRKEYMKEWYAKNKEKVLEKNKKYSKEWVKKNRISFNEREKRWHQKQNSAWLKELHEIGFDKCSKCGYDKCFAAIDLHHDPPIKGGERVWQKWKQIIPTKKRIEAIKKDHIPLCRNCHTELHQKLREEAQHASC